eukprot:1072750-Rhodomonas_salina.1
MLRASASAVARPGDGGRSREGGDLAIGEFLCWAACSVRLHARGASSSTPFRFFDPITVCARHTLRQSRAQTIS